MAGNQNDCPFDIDDDDDDDNSHKPINNKKVTKKEKLMKYLIWLS